MAKTSPDICDLFEQFKQDTTALVAYGDIVVEGNGTSKTAQVRMRACSQRLSLTVQEIERLLSLVFVL